MNRKIGFLIALVAVATVAFTFSAVDLVFANPSQASMTCQGGLNYEGHDYPASGGSTVTAYIDGKRVAGFPKSFGPAISGNVPNPDKTKPHTWKVVWDRVNGTKGDRTQEGSVDSCVIPPTTPTTTTASSTTVPRSTTTIEATTTTVVAETTTSVATDIDTPVVPTTTTVYVGSPTTTTDISQPPTPTGGLPETGKGLTTFVFGCILIGFGLMLLAWNRWTLRKRNSH